MNPKWLNVISDGLILIGILILGAGWNGSANVTGAFPFHSSSVSLTGGATGAHALLGVPTLFVGFILMIISLIWMILDGVMQR